MGLVSNLHLFWGAGGRNAFSKLFPNGLKGSKNVPIRAAVLGNCKDVVAICSGPEAAQPFYRRRPTFDARDIGGKGESFIINVLNTLPKKGKRVKPFSGKLLQVS